MNEAIKALCELEPVIQSQFDGPSKRPFTLTIDEAQIIVNAIKALKSLAGGTHVVVPVEPTEAMIEAGVKDHRHEQSYAGAEETYRAMLAAVPAAIRSLKTKEQT